MAELEMVTAGSVAGPVEGFGRWGILRLLPRWLSDHLEAGGGVAASSGAAAQPLRSLPDLLRDTSPRQAVGGRAAVLALRHTLDAWRAAERDIAALVIGSPDRTRLEAEVAALRVLHHRLFIEVSRATPSGAVEAARS